MRNDSYGRERITLRQTLVMAVLLHLMLAGVAEWRPDLLWSAPVFAEPQPEHRPLEFRFVDTPDREPPVEPPDAEVYSDRGRQAADASLRQDRESPYSEGNTSQQVLRSTPPQATPQPTPAPPAAGMPAEAADARPTDATEVERQPEAAPEPAETAARAGEAPSATATPPLATPPATLPPRQPSLRDVLARLESFVEPEVYDNRQGGADGPQGLVDFDTKGYELGPYLREILEIIERNWKSNIPPAARLPGMQGATFIALSIERVETSSGERARIVMHQTWPSGRASFDQAAQFALEISSPLPPIPRFFPYEKLDGRIGFLYNLDPSEVTFPPRR